MNNWEVECAAILAGGFGTRLKERSNNLPKCLIKFKGLPFLLYQIRWLEKQNFKKIFVCTHFKYQLVIKELKKHKFRNLEVILCNENNPLGTGGAIKNVFQSMKIDKKLFVINGDTFYNFKLNWNSIEKQLKFYQNIIWISERSDSSRYGNIKLRNGKIIEFGEKKGTNKSLVNAGCYLFSSSAFHLKTTTKFSLEKKFLPKLVENNNLGFIIISNDSFYDFGTIESFDKVDNTQLEWLKAND